MVSRIAGAIRSEGVVFLIKVSILWERPESLIDVTRETRVRDRHARCNGIRAGSCPQATRVRREITAQRQKSRVDLVGNNVQCRQVSAL